MDGRDGRLGRGKVTVAFHIFLRVCNGRIFLSRHHGDTIVLGSILGPMGGAKETVGGIRVVEGGIGGS